MPFDPLTPVLDHPSFCPHQLLSSSFSSSNSSLNHHTRMDENNNIRRNPSNVPQAAPTPPFSRGLQFQIPPFIYSVSPTLAPGGGAEVLPMGMLNDSAWFSNNGFTPQFSNNTFFESKETSPSSESQNQQQQQVQHHTTSTSAPFEFDTSAVSINPLPPVQQPIHPNPAELSFFMSSSAAPPMHQDLLATAAATGAGVPSSLGLPVYSSSGFDLLSILSRVTTRPNPRVQLGPVDLSCSFVVVDVRRHDHPIVYCSPTFCRLTGYSENEIIGRNCRFLQSPGGQVQKGEIRRFTSMEAVAHLKKSLGADKECQTSIVNYRKDGQAFINLVTVIPVTGGVSGSPHEDSDVVYHVGFQVDLTEQPNAILEKLRDGSYVVNYSTSQAALGGSGNPGQLHHGGLVVPGLGTAGAAVATKDRKSHTIPAIVVAKELKKLLNSPVFLKSIPVSTSTINPLPLSSAVSSDGSELSIGGGANQPLHLLLLEACPDFIHVVSLKGNFLYVSPSVRRVLGYEPDEMVGKSISDFSHPEDVVPLMRELKESSATGMAATSSGAEGVSIQAQAAPRSVDMLFRARSKTGTYVWIECRGRLHVEPGKGRKAIILSGRAKEMPYLTWEAIKMGGGLAKPTHISQQTGESGDEKISDLETEFWGMISGGGKARGMGTFLMLGEAVQGVLGWSPGDLTGRLVSTILADSSGLEDEIALMGRHIGTQEISTPRQVRCRLRRKDGGLADVLFIVYMPMLSSRISEGISPGPLIIQVKLFDAVSSSGTSPVSSLASAMSQALPSVSLAHPLNANVFEELEISRGSSWQYELQQLKFANQRLLDEIALLEAQRHDDPSHQPPISSPSPRHLYPTGQHTIASHYITSSTPPIRLETPSLEHTAMQTHRLPGQDMPMNTAPMGMQCGSLTPHAASEWSHPLPNSMPYTRHSHSGQRIYHGSPPVGNGSSLKRSWHAIDSTPL